MQKTPYEVVERVKYLAGLQIPLSEIARVEGMSVEEIEEIVAELVESFDPQRELFRTYLTYEAVGREATLLPYSNSKEMTKTASLRLMMEATDRIVRFLDKMGAFTRFKIQHAHPLDVEEETNSIYRTSLKDFVIALAKLGPEATPKAITATLGCSPSKAYNFWRAIKVINKVYAEYYRETVQYSKSPLCVSVTPPVQPKKLRQR